MVAELRREEALIEVTQRDAVVEDGVQRGAGGLRGWRRLWGRGGCGAGGGGCGGVVGLEVVVGLGVMGVVVVMAGCGGCGLWGR